MFGYVDDVSNLVPIIDLSFFCVELEALAHAANLDFNCIESRITHSCEGVSSIPRLRAVDATFADTRGNNPQNSKTPAPNGEGLVMAEITTGFCLLGTPFGSATFAAEFFDQKLEEVQQHADVITTGVEDLQTRLCLFLHFSI